MRILIVDDSRVMRRLIGRALRQGGFVGDVLLEAGNGREGLRMVAEHRPHLVLSDWEMPEMDGIAMLEALRAGGHRMPVGIVTASGSPEMTARAEAAGASFLVTKPFTPETLRDLVRVGISGDTRSPATRPTGEENEQPGAAVPSPKAVRGLLEDLLGRPVDVATTEAFGVEPGRLASLAVYVDRALRTRAVVVADLELSSYAGAAIGLVPPAAAVAAVARCELPPLLVENLHEVFAVVAALLNGPDLPHVVLHAVYPAGTTPPSDLVSFAAVLGQRLDLRATITGYGSGRLALVRVP